MVNYQDFYVAGFLQVAGVAILVIAAIALSITLFFLNANKN